MADNAQVAYPAEGARLKVLVAAYSCRPFMGSEPGVGWNTIRYLAEQHDVWVLTRSNNRPFIEEGLAQMPQVQWVYCDPPIFGRAWYDPKRTLRQHYYLWQVGAYRAARELYRTVKFDIAHHITYVSYWAPNFLHRLPLPFIWGPVGGGEATPAPYYGEYSSKGRLKERLRDLVRVSSHVDPFVRATARRADLCLATTEQTAQVLRSLGGRNVAVQSQLIVSAQEIETFAALPIRADQPFRFISIGRLLEWKGFQFGLRAFAQILEAVPQSEYWIVGDGPYRAALEALVQEYGLGASVQFLGQVPREEVPAKLGACDVLIHPSLHDSGGGVILEAQIARRPVICFDWGGPGILVTEETGIKIYPDNPSNNINQIAAAMRQLAQDPVLLRQKGEAAHRHVLAHYRWDTRVAKFTTIYRELIAAYAAGNKHSRA